MAGNGSRETWKKIHTGLTTVQLLLTVVTLKVISHKSFLIDPLSSSSTTLLRHWPFSAPWTHEACSLLSVWHLPLVLLARLLPYLPSLILLSATSLKQPSLTSPAYLVTLYTWPNFAFFACISTWHYLMPLFIACLPPLELSCPPSGQWLAFSLLSNDISPRT